MVTAVYAHKQGTAEGSSPILEGESYGVCLHITFDGVPGGDINDPGLWFHNVWRSGQTEEGAWMTIFPPGDGTSDIERAHLGCVARIKQIASSRGVELETSDITCAGTE
jgi:hypothetical protein